MQIVLSNNRIIAHGENFLAMGGVVINTETGAKYENATIAECEGCPSDIDSVGYEYHAGVFVPCAPYGKGNNNGFFMEVCETCATPRSSGIPIKGGLKTENFDKTEVTAAALGGANFSVMWENPNPTQAFAPTTIPVTGTAVIGFVVEYVDGQCAMGGNSYGTSLGANTENQSRKATRNANGIFFDVGKIKTPGLETWNDNNAAMIPLRIYAIKLR